MDLWIEKYKPGSLKDMVAQKKPLEETLQWLNSFKPGKALFLHGPSGVGKNVLLEIIAKENDYLLVELNASDKRASKEIDAFLQTTQTHTLFHKGKIIVIDEIDAISAGDRGGAKSIINLIKKSCFPVFLVANDAYLPKLKTVRTYCKLVKFNKVHSPSITKKLADICKEEGIIVNDGVLKNLARWSQGDLRSAIIDLQTVCSDKKELTDKDLEVLGYRERENSLFNLLPTIFRSKNMSTAKKAIYDSDKDPDEIFWWIENNIHSEFSIQELPMVYEILSKADIFRSFVIRQQNYAFKGFMVDMLSVISIPRNDSNYKFIMYQPPRRFIQLAITKQKRLALNSLCEKMGKLLHCSKKNIKKEYIPYLKIILKKQKKIEGLNLSPEELKLIKSG